MIVIYPLKFRQILQWFPAEDEYVKVKNSGASTIKLEKYVTIDFLSIRRNPAKMK
jgi:hypothetical protein